MLFIFETTDQYSFHMKNTFIPLDIAFINEEGIIESIKELEPMNPIPVYPEGDIRYAIEVNRGWFAENGIEVGDIILEDTEETEIDLNEVKDKKGKGSGTKDACYHKVKSRYSVWPSAYASGALVKCRKVGAANWGNSRKEEVEFEKEYITEVDRELTTAAVVGGKLVTKGIKAAKEVGKLIKQGVRTKGVPGGSIKPKKGFYNVKSGPNTPSYMGMTRPATGGKRTVKASYGKKPEKSFMQSQKDKLEAQKKGI
ncbi:MAG: DUF192 domain-containing protein, partial [Pseudomonadota bacterium]|nr:DUF192 domain-containing protein [Pseudomonadota bacterium]